MLFMYYNIRSAFLKIFLMYEKINNKLINCPYFNFI